MGKQSQIKIKEDLEILNSYKQKVSNFKSSKKLELLLYIISNPNQSLVEVSKVLSISYTTLHRWLRIYVEKGIAIYLSPERRSKPSKIITPAIHKELEALIGNQNVVFNGYKDVQQWLRTEHNVDIEYQWLWKYLRTKLGTTLKVPRKSNIKKDKDASAEFFKTT